jgi:hypothetical protein
MRKVIRIVPGAAPGHVVVLCKDGTLWKASVREGRTEWEPMDPPPSNIVSLVFASSDGHSRRRPRDFSEHYPAW